MKKVILCLIVFLGFAFLFKNSIYAEPKDPIKEKADSFWSICDGLEQKGKANFIYPKYVYRLKPFTVGLISTNKVFTLKATFILGLNDENCEEIFNTFEENSDQLCQAKFDFGGNKISNQGFKSFDEFVSK